MPGGFLDEGIIKQAGSRFPGWMNNIGFAAVTTTNANDSIKITGADGTALSPVNYGWVTLPDVTSGKIKEFNITADVTIDLTGAHWGFGTLGDLTDERLYVYAINNDGTLVWGVALKPARALILNADDSATASSITTYEQVLVNSALTADAQALQVGWFKANFDDTGGAAEDLWSIQTGDEDINVGLPLIRPRVVYVKDEKSSTTTGGTFTSGDWRTRDLNTIEGDVFIVSVATNAMTFKPGTYDFEWSAPANNVVNSHKTRLQNTTAASTVAFGSVQKVTIDQNQTSVGFARTTITVSSAFEIQHFGQTTSSGQGFGVASGAGDGAVEIYTQVKITEVL